jgi:hypothetical protein
MAWDFLRVAPSKKQKKREVLANNQARGKAAEQQFELTSALEGEEVVRTGRGSDYRVRKRDPWTGRVTSSKLVEVKSGKAKLSKLQRKTKKKKSNYAVKRVDPLIW